MAAALLGTLTLTASSSAASPREVIAFSSSRSAVLGPHLDSIDTRTGAVRRVAVPGDIAMPSPDGRRIAFIDQLPTSGFGVFVARADGTGRRLLYEHDNVATFTDLSWSPNGRLIAFPFLGPKIGLVSPEGGPVKFVDDARRVIWLRDSRHIAVLSERDSLDLVDLGGGRSRGARGVWNGDWSSDGRLTAKIDSGFGKLTVSNARSHRVLLHTREEVAAVRFSPDARSVAFIQKHHGWELATYDLSTRVRHVLARRLRLGELPAQPIEWSPAGNEIAVACGSSVIVAHPVGGRTRTYDEAWPVRHPIAPPRWLRSKLLVTTTTWNNDREVYIADAATGRAVAVTHNRVDDDDPMLSPDRRFVAYVRGQAVWIVALDGTHERRLHAGFSPAWSRSGELALVEGGKIKLVDPVTGAVRRVVATGDEPAWSPDGSTIAYEHDGDIWAVAPDGSGAHRITSGLVLDRMPAYSPDGKRIAYRAVPGDGVGVFTADAADGANVTRLSKQSGLDPVWSPDGTRIALEYFGTLQIVDSADGAHAHLFSPAEGWSGAPDWR